MARRKRQNEDDTLIDIVEVKDQAQGFIEGNQNTIFGIAAIIIGLILVVFAYNNFIKEPKNNEAIEAMTTAQTQFERDSFTQALLNPGAGQSGFLDIIDNYSGTKAANLAHYYAGISYLHLGDYATAISFLEDFNAGGSISPIMKAGALGDAYSENGDMDKALSMYKKAANTNKVDVLTAYYLKKYGMLCEVQNKPSEAIAAYEEIKEDYSTTPSGRDIEKYIVRLQK